MHQLKIAIIFLLITLTGFNAIPLEENRDQIKNDNSNNDNNKNSSESVRLEKPVIIDKENKVEGDTTTTTKAPTVSTEKATEATSTEKVVEIKILETSSTSSTSIKKEPTRTTKAPTRTRTTRTTKPSRPRKTTPKPSNETLPGTKQPLTRQDWLKLIENEMATYEKKSGSSPISNKNLTIISERILKYLVENGTQVGISLREQKDGTIKFMKSNVTLNDKIYGEGTESKFPPILEFVVQRIQAYFSVYAHEDHSRPANTQKNDDDMSATVREEPDDDDDDTETSTLSNDEVIDQLEDELTEFIGSDVVKNVTQIKLPSLIKTAYEKIQSWFVPTEPAAKEEPVQESEEEDATSTESGIDGDKKPTKKPSIIKGAYDALEAILSVFEDIDVSDEEEKVETPQSKDPELKEAQDDLEEAEIKETVGENLYDFLKLAYTLYDEDEA